MWGKSIGAGIGAAIGMLLAGEALVALALSLMGLVLGHLLFDRHWTKAPPRAPTSTSTPTPIPVPPAFPEADLVRTLCPIFVELARCDGAVVQSEIRAVREYFQHQLGFGTSEMEAVRVALKNALSAPDQGLEGLVKEARLHLKPSLRLEFVRALYDVALADAKIGRPEQDALKEIVAHLHLSDEQLQNITSEAFGSGQNFYEILGLPVTATDDDIRAAFRKLAAEHHPDRAASLGPQEAEVASERFRALKDAYDGLRRLRGF